MISDDVFLSARLDCNLKLVTRAPLSVLITHSGLVLSINKSGLHLHCDV